MKILSLLLSFMLLSSLENNFLSEQKKFERVRSSIAEKQPKIEATLAKFQLTTTHLDIAIVAFKEEKIVELYAKTHQATTYQKITSYQVCQSSGELGPKRKQGDYQVPEGFYHIDRFNPMSNFYLSLGINYPNEADRKKSTASNLGGDIFIHGNCVSVGCLPITDEYIKELYLYAVYAKNSGQSKIPVYIFPFRLSDEKMKVSNPTLKENPTLISFWQNLKKGYDLFEAKKIELKFKIDSKGNYVF